MEREYFTNGTSNLSVQAYHQYRVDLAVMFGADRTRAQEDMTAVLEFEIKLAEVDYF
jgi:hypothetical protein